MPPLAPPRRRTARWTRVLIVIAAVALGIYALLIAALYWGQERLLFYPQPLPAAHRFDVAGDVHERWVDVPGARLNALHLQLPNPRGIVFFLHGNAGNLASWFVNIDFYRRANVDLFMIDYRGYGKSSGRITSQAQLVADTRAAWAAIAPLYAGKPRVVYGRSLGSGLAAMLAAELQPELTVLVSPFSSMGALAREHYPWVPLPALRYPLNSTDNLARVKTPVLLIHGARDTLIAPLHSQRLLQAAPHAQLLLLPDAAHGDVQEFAAYRDALAAALTRL